MRTLSEAAPLPKSNKRAQLLLLFDINQSENDKPEFVLVTDDIRTYCNILAESRRDPVPTLTSISFISTLISDAFNETADPPFKTKPVFVTVPKSNESSKGRDETCDSDVYKPGLQSAQVYPKGAYEPVLP